VVGDREGDRFIIKEVYKGDAPVEAGSNAFFNQIGSALDGRVTGNCTYTDNGANISLTDSRNGDSEKMTVSRERLQRA
jgi:hypothetical protein